MFGSHIAIATALLLGAGCVGLPAAGLPSSAPAGPGGGARVTVIEGEDLWRSRGSVLGSMAGRLANVRIQRTTGCPTLEMRGRSSRFGETSPTVYVDGARAVNTCVLEQVRAEDVQRVEVYPMGVTTRPGYRGNSAGLILVFTRGSRQ